MSNKGIQNDSPVRALKNESARQRWELFHRAIAHAKETNTNALADAEQGGEAPADSGPILTIVR